MKKHKSVISILLAIMMIFTFMPTMAFADAGDGFAPANVEEGHNWDKGKVVKKATSCLDYKLTEYKCTGQWVNESYEGEEDGDHLDCGASYVEIEIKDHDFGEKKPNYKNVSADEFLEQVKKQVSAATYKNYAEEIYEEQYCYVVVPVCKDCGEYDLTDVNYFHHKKPNVLEEKPCTETYVCGFCGKTVDNTGHANHTWNTQGKKLQGTYCSAVDLSSDALAGGFTVYEYECSVCGAKELRAEQNAGDETVDHVDAYGKLGGVAEAVTPAAGESKYYVEYKGKYYAPNVILPIPEGQNPCTYEAEAAFVCPKDGEIVGTCRVKAKGHNYETQTLAATCEDAGYSLTICKDCGDVKEYTKTAEATGHKYKENVLAPASCFADGISIVECENCGRVELLNYSNNIKMETPAGSTAEDVYFLGFNKELKKDDAKNTDTRIKVADWRMKTHDYGKYEDMAEATCVSGVLQARKCSICGLYDVHHTMETGQPKGHQWVKTTQDPTCGAKGFEYEICSVCGAFNDETYKEFGDPVVAYGTKCKMDKWVVETAATPFAEGTKKLVCSVCGDDGHIFMEGANIKEGNVTRTSIAKTKIAAPKVKSLKKKAKVTVKAVAGATKYQILVNGKVSKTVKKAGTFTVKKGIKAGKKNKFQIRAINADGVKATSKAKSLKIKK